MTARTGRRMLEFQSDRIEATLARHQVRVRVTGGTVAPRWIQFQVQPALGTRVNKIRGLAEELDRYRREVWPGAEPVSLGK